MSSKLVHVRKDRITVDDLSTAQMASVEGTSPIGARLYTSGNDISNTMHQLVQEVCSAATYASAH